MKKNGFTLIELLLYISLVSVMIFSVVQFYMVLISGRVKNRVVGEVEQQASQVMQIITQTTRNASAVNLPLLNQSGGTLSVGTTNPATSPTVFDSSGGTIRIKEGASSPISLTSNSVSVSNLTFYNLSTASTNGSIRVLFTLSYANPDGRNELDYSKTFYGSATLRP